MERFAWVEEALVSSGTVLVRLTPELQVHDVVGDAVRVLGEPGEVWIGRGLAELPGEAAAVAEAWVSRGAAHASKPSMPLEMGDGSCCRLADGGLVLRLSARQKASRGVIARMADHLPVMVAYVDRDFCFRFNNRAYLDFIGLPAEALMGQPVSSVLDAGSYAKIRPRFDLALAGQEVSYEDSLVLQDGRQIYFKVHYLPDVVEDEVMGFYAIIQDVSEYRSMIQLLRDVHTGVNRTDIGVSEIVDMLLRDALSYLRLDIALVSQVEGERYTVRWAASDNAPIAPGDSFALGDTYCRLTLDADDVFHTHRAGQDERVKGHPCYENFQLETYIGAPLRIQGKVWGTLNFSSPSARRHAFSEVDIELLRLLASAVERVISNEMEVERIRLERDQLEDQAMTDALTGLPNRSQLDRHVTRLIEDCDSGGAVFSLAAVDIDFFKQVNDGFGHSAGDQVLTWLAQTVANCLRDGDLVARTGGEEFVVVMRRTALPEAIKAAERVRRAVEGGEIRLADDRMLGVTISIGVSQYRKGEGFAPLFERADRRLYSAKRSGRNRVCAATDGESSQDVSRI
ncbi:bifunctional diguanylate cyclase/phosphodiesterase [Halomonas litopenaei]|uniref:sensor domain-containing diguanylate cyclase n=1 Tax=Halomonas litopenaei TaxID=2109328 RepID=UPI003F9F375D